MRQEKSFTVKTILFQSGNRNRGRWSDDDDEFARPHAHQRKPLHPPPDRVIDFSHVSKHKHSESF